MNVKQRPRILFLGVLLVLAEVARGEPATTFSHSDWTAVLSRFVDEKGAVDYDGLARDRATFDRYIASIKQVSPTSHPDLFPTRQHELAYYINAYNALVFSGVLVRGPEQESVWRGGLISGYSFFVRMKITLGGERTNLKHLEDNIIRKGFQDPRVHAALNCASISCPRLPQKAFDPDNLDAELDEAMREFVEEERHVYVDESTRTAQLSKIFDWFAEDFLEYERGQGNSRPTLIDYINRYRRRNEQIQRDYTITFLKYDKGINRQ